MLKTDRYKISSTNSYWNFYRMMQYAKWPWCLCWLWGFTKQVGLGLCSSLAWFQMLVLRMYPKCVLKNPESSLQLTSPSTITLGQMHQCSHQMHQCSQATMGCFSRKKTLFLLRVHHSIGNFAKTHGNLYLPPNEFKRKSLLMAHRNPI